MRGLQLFFFFGGLHTVDKLQVFDGTLKGYERARQAAAGSGFTIPRLGMNCTSNGNTVTISK